MESAIEVKNISKQYKLYNSNQDRLKETFDFISHKKYHREFNALDNINFSIYKGETVGIIGTNGSGKSTLLKIVTGVLTQTSGEVVVRGRVSALLELGAGFNPEYTGLENIYLNGTIMGISREEMDEKVDEIIEFSGIGEFIYQPVKTYSSGMFARLAFSVAINVDPDILIVDEALSVGDMAFQEKSVNKMKELRDKGKTILFVTHSLPLVRSFCTRAIWIDKGRMVEDGSSEKVCDDFHIYMTEKDDHIEEQPKHIATSDIKGIEIVDVSLDKEEYYMNEDIILKIGIKFNRDINKYGIGVIIYDVNGKIVTLFNTARDDIKFDKQYNEFELKIPNNDFMYGKYYITVSISDDMILFGYDSIQYVKSFRVLSEKNIYGTPIAEGMFRCKHEWKYK